MELEGIQLVGYAYTWYVYIATEDGRTLGIMTLRERCSVVC
jgi:hypothetical protein